MYSLWNSFIDSFIHLWNSHSEMDSHRYPFACGYQQTTKRRKIRHLLEFEFKLIQTWNQASFINIVDELLSEKLSTIASTISCNENLFNSNLHFIIFILDFIYLNLIDRAFIPNPTFSITEEVKILICNSFSCLYNFSPSEFMSLLQYCFIINLNEILINHLSFPVKWPCKWFSHYRINLVVKEKK